MSDETPMGQVIQTDEARIRDHLGEMVRGTVEETLLLDPGLRGMLTAVVVVGQWRIDPQAIEAGT